MASSARVTHVLLVLLLLAVLAVIGMLATGVRGGPLDPPGAPGSTDGVREPGTPISSLPFVISQPGHYYLTRNLTGGAGTTGIAVNASNVTIDLGGFTLTGAATNGAGIEATQYQFAIRITNGNFKNWGTAIALYPTVYSRVDNVTIIDAENVGIDLGFFSVAEDCNVSSGAHAGINVRASTLRNCTVIDNGDSGVSVGGDSHVHDNLIRNNVLSGATGLGDLTVTADSSLFERNRVGVIYVTGDRNMFEGNSAVDLLFWAGAQSNAYVRGSFCSGLISDASNYAPHIVFSSLVDTGGGHLAIQPERNMFVTC